MSYIGVLGRGFLIWVIPLVVSFFFYSPARELVTSYALFKSVMVFVLTLVTLGVNIIRPVTFLTPWVVAAVYTAISIILDVLIVMPMAGLTPSAYMEQIGLIYIVIPALTWGILSRYATGQRSSHGTIQMGNPA